MTQNYQPSSHHPALFFLLSRRFSLYLGAFLTLIYLVLCLLRRHSSLTTYVLSFVFVAALTFAGICIVQDVYLRTFLIRKYGTSALGFVLSAKTQWDSNGVPNRMVLIEYGTYQGTKHKWFYHNNLPERDYILVLYNPYAPDQVMLELEKHFSRLEIGLILLVPLYIALAFFGCAIWLLWVLFTSS